MFLQRRRPVDPVVAALGRGERWQGPLAVLVGGAATVLTVVVTVVTLHLMRAHEAATTPGLGSTSALDGATAEALRLPASTQAAAVRADAGTRPTDATLPAARDRARALADDLEAASRTVARAHLADSTGTATYVADAAALVDLLRTAAAARTPSDYAATGPGIVADLDRLAAEVEVTSSTAPAVTRS